MKNKLRKIIKYNLILLALVVIYVFVIGLIPLGTYKGIAYSLTFSLIYLISAGLISEKGHTGMFVYAGITIAVLWLSELLHLELVSILSAIISIGFIILIIIMLLTRVARSNQVSILEFIEAVNIYFLMGIIGSILFRVVYEFVPGNSFNLPDNNIIPNIDFIYFSFVTLTTLGYGDITPIDPFAKSLAVFLSISGQLYLTMIIAVLVGKYLSKK